MGVRQVVAYAAVVSSVAAPAAVAESAPLLRAGCNFTANNRTVTLVADAVADPLSAVVLATGVTCSVLVDGVELHRLAKSALGPAVVAGSVVGTPFRPMAVCWFGTVTLRDGRSVDGPTECAA